MKPKKNKKISQIFTIASVIAIAVWIFGSIRPVYSAGIDSVVTTMVTSAAVNTESQVTVVFTPATALVAADTITVYLGEVAAGGGGDPWKDTDTTVDSTDVTCVQSGTTFNGYVQTDATNTVPLLVSCNVNTVGAGTAAVTVTIGTSGTDSLYNPNGADGYPVAVVTNDDSGAGVAYIGDGNDVTVSATVLPNLTLTIDDGDGTYCVTASGVTTCNLGTVLTTAENSGSYDVTVGGNADDITVSLGENGDLLNGGEAINDVGDGDITAGSEEYGVIITETGTAWSIDGTYSATEAPIITGPDTVATSTGPVNSGTNNIDVVHRVAVASSTPALTYSHIVTWTATANF